MSSRTKIYKDFLGFLSPASATRLLVFFVSGLALAEVAARIVDPRYERTAVSSLHGVRSIFQQTLEDAQPKILAFGDSTLVGGGIYEHEKTVLGQMQQALATPSVYNLAVPSGDTVTSALLLNALKQRGIQNVDRVIIEVLPTKFMLIGSNPTYPLAATAETRKELQRMVPGLNGEPLDIPMATQSLPDRVEAAAQWELGRFSRLYRHRDYFRTEVVGNYPPFWLTGRLVPRSIMARIQPAKARGTNRVAARMRDFDFEPASAEPPVDLPFKFQRDSDQGRYLEKSLVLAREISEKPPIILAMPQHYEFEKLTGAQLAERVTAIREFESYIRSVATRHRVKALIIKSETFQNPKWWTITPAHFNDVGAREIWRRIKPQICSLNDCTAD